MLIYVLRHGITQWNKLKKVQGAMDIPLAPEGIELAKRTGEALKDVPLISVLPVLWQERDRQHIMCWETGRFLLLRIKESRKLILEFLKEAGLRMNKGRSSAMKWKFSLKSHRNLNVLKTDRKSTRLNSSHTQKSRMPSSA